MDNTVLASHGEKAILPFLQTSWLVTIRLNYWLTTLAKTYLLSKYNEILTDKVHCWFNEQLYLPDNCISSHYILYHAVKKYSPPLWFTMFMSAAAINQGINQVWMPAYWVVIFSGRILAALPVFCNSDVILLESVLKLKKFSSISGYMRITEIGPDFYGLLIALTQKVSSKAID